MGTRACLLAVVLVACGGATEPQQPVVSPYEDGGEDGTTTGDGTQCVAGEAACKGACTNLQSDSQHCGTCGNACGAGQRCSIGQCVAGGHGDGGHGGGGDGG